MTKYQLEAYTAKTLILIDKGKHYLRIKAIRKILLELPYFKIFGYLLYLIPTFIGNIIYDIIAKKRQKILKSTSCPIPSAEIRKKIIS